jgi:hypothetical protein
MDETGVSLHSSPVGEPGEGGPSIGNFENYLKEGTGYGGSTCMGDLLREPRSGAALLGALKVMKGRLWGWVSLFMWAQLHNLEWACLQGNLGDG